MVRYSLIAVFALSLVASAQSRSIAQPHGVPPSVTSMTSFGPGGRFAVPHGVPPSVTSFAPDGFRGPKTFIPGFRGRFPKHFHGKGFGVGFGFGTGVPVVPYYVPYSYGVPVYVVPYEVDNEQQAPSNVQPVSDAEPPAQTIFERRPTTEYPPDSSRYGEHTFSGRERRPEAREDERDDAKPTEPQVTEIAPQEPTILVFRDGHKIEISNYAIQGATLFNLSGDGPYRIRVADLDIAATVKANEDRGNLFNVPQAALRR